MQATQLLSHKVDIGEDCWIFYYLLLNLFLIEYVI